ncbi:MAG: hypothetical protein AAF415_06265 [Pseudomonadota bacterium]
MNQKGIIMRFVLLGALVFALSSCAAMRETNYKNIFKVAYAQEAEQTATDTYKVSFRFIVFPSANRAQERENMFTGMLGALARKGKALGFVTMQTHDCQGTRGRAGGSYYIEGRCSAKMFRDALEPSSEVHLIEAAHQKAEARQAQLEKL